jgi:hypothetical protein
LAILRHCERRSREAIQINPHEGTKKKGSREATPRFFVSSASSLWLGVNKKVAKHALHA